MDAPRPRKPLYRMTSGELREYAESVDRWWRLEGLWGGHPARMSHIRSQTAIGKERRRRGEQLKLPGLA